MSISMYTGRPGTGKTFYAVNDVIKKLNQGYLVYSNIHINWNGYQEKETWLKNFLIKIKLKKSYKNFPSSNLRYWKRLEDLFNLEDGIIFIDEAHVYINSRRWKNMPEEMERKLAQHRKDGLHILGTVQNVNRLDVIFRELIDYWFVCDRFFSFIIATEFDIDEDKQKKYPLRKKFIRLTRQRCERYDTLAKVVIY